MRKLEQFFTDVSHLPVAETELCGYGRFYQELRTKISNKSHDYYLEEANKRRNTPSWGVTSPSEQGEADSILNSRQYFDQRFDMNNRDLTSWSSFPWEEYNRDFSELENKNIQFGRAFILYPFGLTFNKLDGLFGKYLNYHLEDVPGIMDFALNSFVFKKKFRETSQKILTSIAQEFRKQNPKKFRRRQDITFVGVHHRRGDLGTTLEKPPALATGLMGGGRLDTSPKLKRWPAQDASGSVSAPHQHHSTQVRAC